MKYYSQYHSHELFELQESLSGLSKSDRWVKLADNLPWDKIEKGRFFVYGKIWHSWRFYVKTSKHATNS